MNVAKLRQELVQDEGLRLVSYQDTLGNWTIGVGHLLGKVRRMTTITMREAMILLAGDIEAAEEIAEALVPNLQILGDVRMRAIVNLAFNLGPKLGEFTHFLAAIAERNWSAASYALKNSLWATQVGARAARIQTMIVMGDG